LEYVAACLIGYLLGSVPVAPLVARRYGVDLRRTSDGNPGAWNALEQLGPRRAWPAFVGDGAKGSLAAAAGLAIGGIGVGYAAAAAAMLGHALPLFARFRGGKSVMTFVGAALVLAPLAAAICAVGCVVATLVTRSFAVGARVGVFCFPVVQLMTDPVDRVTATGCLMTMIGLLFVLRRRSVPATSARDAPRTR